MIVPNADGKIQTEVFFSQCAKLLIPGKAEDRRDRLKDHPDAIGGIGPGG